AMLLGFAGGHHRLGTIDEAIQRSAIPRNRDAGVGMKTRPQLFPFPEIEAERPGSPDVTDLNLVQRLRPFQRLVHHRYSLSSGIAARACIASRPPFRLTHLRVKASVGGISNRKCPCRTAAESPRRFFSWDWSRSRHSQALPRPKSCASASRS